MGKHIVWLGDMGSIGSGYKTLALPLMVGLAAKGYELKCLAMEYHGEEHPFDFSIIPVDNPQEFLMTLKNLDQIWGVDVLIVSMDIPPQIDILKNLSERKYKYIGIFPVEADPLVFSWAMSLMEMDKRFVISEFGTQECLKMGVDAEHICLGIDTDSWKVPTLEERKALRDSFGFTDDTFVVFTNAANQERKNLSRSMEIFADFCKENPEVDAKYLMVTMEHFPLGWKLRDYAQSPDIMINSNLLIYERGIDFKKLWMLYAISDVMLLTSKAEGLGIPLLEAMAVGVPCLATDCTAIHELLSDGMGTLIDYDYVHVDPFGNGHRYWASRSDGTKKLTEIYKTRDVDRRTAPRKYVEGRSWKTAIEQLDNAIKELTDGLPDVS